MYNKMYNTGAKGHKEDDGKETGCRCVFLRFLSFHLTCARVTWASEEEGGSEESCLTVDSSFYLLRAPSLV
jgi:hypothetical protein